MNEIQYQEHIAKEKQRLEAIRLNNEKEAEALRKKKADEQNRQHLQASLIINSSIY